MEVKEIVNLLEKIAPTANDWRSIGTILREHVSEGEIDNLWIYIFAFEYMYVEESNREYYEYYGPFAPWIEMDGKVFPPPLDKINDEILSEWADTLEKIKHPTLVSRLADLLWARKWQPRPNSYAIQAIESYWEISKGNWERLYRARCLIRSLDLSKEINDVERKKKAIQLIIDACYEELHLEDPKPGISLRLITSLTKLNKTDQSEEVNVLLNLAFKTHENDVWIVENIVELMINRETPEKRKQLQLYLINRWVEEAEKSKKGLLLLHNLEHALELARNYGLQDAATDIRKKIQSVPPETLEMKEFSTKIEVPAEQIEKFLNWFIDERGWKESFERLGFHGPPSGDYKKNIEEIEKQAQDYPLQFLASRAVYDHNNVPIRYGRNIDENKEIAIAGFEALNINVFGSFAPSILERIKQKYNAPSDRELSEFFTTSIIPKDIAENIAIAIDWFFKGESNITTHLLVPQIEAILRILARDLGLPIIREPIGNIPGGVITLGTLLNMLKDKIDESWRRYFINLLTNPIGINLRNRVCHGLLPNFGKEDAALLIQVACNLRLIKITDMNKPEKSEPE